MTTFVDYNDIAMWLPQLEAAGLPVPRTALVHCEDDLTPLLDGQDVPGFMVLVEHIRQAAYELGYPEFLRTGHLSGKHRWRYTCHLAQAENVAGHVYRLIEESHMADLMGLPTNTWAVRELLETEPLFVCEAYDGFPVTREFRLFVKDGIIQHVQPYWPIKAVLRGRPDVPEPEARKRLGVAGQLSHAEELILYRLAVEAGAACAPTGCTHWSVDLLQDRHEK